MLKFLLQVYSSIKFSFFKFQVLRRIEGVCEGAAEPLHIFDASSSNREESLFVTSSDAEALLIVTP